MVLMPMVPSASSARAELLPTKVTHDEQGGRGENPRHEGDQHRGSPIHELFCWLLLPQISVKSMPCSPRVKSKTSR